MSGPGRLDETAVCLTCGEMHWSAMGHACSRGRRIRHLLIRLSHRMPVFVRAKPKRSGRCDCPFCSSKELRARARTGMPMRHPERILRNLPDDQEKLLTVLAEATWPAMEYIDITAEPPGEQ